jgi:two-component system sensor kinase FixL
VIFPIADPGTAAVADERDRVPDYRAFFECAGTGNVIVDLKTGHFVAMNDAFCGITGYSRDELSEMSASDLTHPDDRLRDMRGWRQALERNEVPYVIEKRYVRRDGGVVSVSVTSTVIRNAAGMALHAAGTVLRMPEETFSGVVASLGLRGLSGAVLEASPVAVIALDDSRHVEIWNPEASRLFGLTAAQARGRRLLDLPLKWRSPDALDALLDQPANEQAALEVETPAGHVLELSVWCAPYVRDDGFSDGRVLLVLDESEKKQLERTLFDAGDSEQRRVGQELHEGLCQQLMGATFVAQALYRELERDHSHCAERAESLARLLSDSVMQGRNLARGINPVEIDSAGLMSALHEFADRSRTGAHVELRCDHPVLVDSAEVALHVFRIAQEAAAIALRQAGATRVLIRLAEVDGSVVLQVSDNGSCERGAGVGLGIMKYRAQAIRGELAVEASPGSGTTVTCVFPNN